MALEIIIFRSLIGPALGNSCFHFSCLCNLSFLAPEENNFHQQIG